MSNDRPSLSLLLAQILPLVVCLGGPALFVSFIGIIIGAAP